ncbi:MAG: DNA-binding protein [Proteobacteria bacterium]|nr:MAG: DNA-binding protein [Pseudomonadota bacterium]
MKQTPTSKNEELLTIADVARILQLSESRIRYEVFHKRIPFLKIGRSVRFQARAIQRWIIKGVKV